MAYASSNNAAGDDFVNTYASANAANEAHANDFRPASVAVYYGVAVALCAVGGFMMTHTSHWAIGLLAPTMIWCAIKQGISSGEL